jgi:hypothetical protein
MIKPKKPFVFSFYNTQVKSEKAIGFCWTHKVFLTSQQLKTHGCLGKQCRNLDRIEHQFWIDREEKQKARAEKKKQLNELYERVRSKNE